MRQIPFSIPPAAPDEAPGAEQGNGHAEDLRARGASQPPRAPSSPAEREQAELVDWLTRDLKPKHSLRPGRTSAPPSLAPGSLSLGGVEVPSGASSPPSRPSAEARPSQAPPRASGEVAVTRAGAVSAARVRLALAVGVALLLAFAALVRRGDAPAAPVEGGSPAPAPAAR
ncbi:MAG TPA: hypothetical protein VNN80_29020 [Polyangiaceae bacterium]|nr:hypothetical protein [Polyangiaceae bacterium]